MPLERPKFEIKTFPKGPGKLRNNPDLQKCPYKVLQRPLTQVVLVQGCLRQTNNIETNGGAITATVKYNRQIDSKTVQ